MNSSGWSVTSKNCSGLRRMFFSARQAIERVWPTVSARLVRARVRATAAAGSTVRVAVLIGPPPGRARRVRWDRARRSASWPVIVRKTSSRVGLSTLTEAIATRGLAQGDQHVRRPVGDGERRVDAAGLGRQHRLAAEDAADDVAGERLVGAGGELQLERRAADRGLQLVGRALRDLAAAVDDRDPVGELIGLVEVLRGQQDRAAVGDQVPDRVPHLAAGARVQAGGRLVEEDQRRPRDQARREVQPAPHAARELRQRPVGGLLEPELLEQAAARSREPRPSAALQASEQPQVLAGREVLVDRRVLAGDADQLADTMRLAGDVDAEDPRLARVDRQQRREHPQHRGLAGAVRSEDAEDLALAHLEVDAVDGAQVAELLHQSARVDGRCLCHVSSSGCKHPEER